MKKYRLERKGRRSFDTALEYDTTGMMVSEKTRTTKPVVRATCYHGLTHVCANPQRR